MQVIHKPPALLLLELRVCLILIRMKWNDRKALSVMPYYCCMCSKLAHIDCWIWCHLYTVNFYLRLCVSCSQLRSFLGPYWISYFHSKCVFVMVVIFICDAWSRDPRASAWYSVVLHLLNVFKCYSDVKTTFTMWMQGLFKSGGSCQRIWKLIVLTNYEFHCTLH